MNSLRLDIQGLRAVAVLLVVLFHINHNWLPGGFIGVDVFFVISGFLISKALLKQRDDAKFNYIKFLIGRIKRIVPAYFAMLLLVVITGSFLLVPADYSALLYDLRTSAIFMSNQVFANANDYFGAKSYEKALLHTWSLCIEMQFYLLLPLLIVYLPKRFCKWVLIILGIVIFIYTEYQIKELANKTSMYFSLIARASEFIVGILINFVPTSSRVSSRDKNLLGYFSIIVLLTSCFLVDENSNFPGLYAIIPCFATAIIIWLENSALNKFLSHGSLVYIGALSYSLYLWHWPVLALYRYQIVNYDLGILGLIITVILMSLLTLFSYYIIEEPFKKLSQKQLFYRLSPLLAVVGLLWFFQRMANNKIQETEMVFTSPNGFDMRNHAQYDGYHLLGNTTVADDKIVVIGDSHALAMSSFIDYVGKENDFNFSMVSANTVPPLEGINDTLILKEYLKQYKELVPVANSLIKKSKIIVLVKLLHGDKYPYFDKVLTRLIQKLDKSQHLIIVSDYPSVDKNPVRLYKSILKPADFKRQSIKFPKTAQHIITIASQYDNVHYLELQNESYFKDAPFYNDTLMYYDESHLNHYGSVNYAKFEGYKLAKLLKEIKEKN